MTNSIAYVMLLSSLPRPGPLFVEKQTPLSRLRLEQRLRVLTPEDKATLKLVEGALRWDHFAMSTTEAEVLARGRPALQNLDNETLRDIVLDRLELRTMIAAIRRRHRGEPPPSGDQPWGLGRWVRRIEANWNDAGFGLDGVFRWAREADRLMRAGETLALERLILEQAWKFVARRGGTHEFDFEAVVMYVLKWNIVERWSRYEAVGAAERFAEMTDAAMAEHATLFPGGQA